MITTKTMLKQLRIFEIIIICVLAKSLYCKSLNTTRNQVKTKENARLKRGHSHYGGNDFGSSVHVSSGVLQYGSGSGDNTGPASLPAISLEHSESLDHSSTISEFSASNHIDPWSAAGLSPGYDVWLEPLAANQGTSALDSAISSKHNAVNNVFSDDSPHSTHFKLPSSQLHTQIASSSSIDNGPHDLGTLLVSDNIDFNNDADIKAKHYAKSYGK